MNKEKTGMIFYEVSGDRKYGDGVPQYSFSHYSYMEYGVKDWLTIGTHLRAYHSFFTTRPNNNFPTNGFMFDAPNLFVRVPIFNIDKKWGLSFSPMVQAPNWPSQGEADFYNFNKHKWKLTGALEFWFKEKFTFGYLSFRYSPALYSGVKDIKNIIFFVHHVIDEYSICMYLTGSLINGKILWLNPMIGYSPSKKIVFYIGPDITLNFYENIKNTDVMSVGATIAVWMFFGGNPD